MHTTNNRASRKAVHFSVQLELLLDVMARVRIELLIVRKLRCVILRVRIFIIDFEGKMTEVKHSLDSSILIRPITSKNQIKEKNELLFRADQITCFQGPKILSLLFYVKGAYWRFSALVMINLVTKNLSNERLKVYKSIFTLPSGKSVYRLFIKHIFLVQIRIHRDRKPPMSLLNTKSKTEFSGRKPSEKNNENRHFVDISGSSTFLKLFFYIISETG